MIEIKDYGFTRFYEQGMEMEKDNMDDIMFARVTQVHRDIFNIKAWGE